ncbi:MAG: hypothetical protein L6R48_24855, partial [Planctomycetes bacterium]|nr:hypothetical protein [Planctomycetota bacterium]
MHPPTRWACLLLLACALLRGAEPTVTPAALDLVEDQAPVDLRVFNLAPRAGSTSSATLQLLASVVDATVLAATVAAFDRDAGTATIAIRPLADANGTTQVVITLVDPLGVVGSAVVPVAVGAQNDIPRFQSWSPYFMGRVSFYTLNRNATRMTDPDGDAIRYTIIALPQHGRLLGPLGPARPMGLGEVFTQTDIDELRISYEAAAPTLTNDSLRVAIDDGHAPTADGWMQMSIVFTYLGEPSVPGIGLGASPAAVWTEGAAALAVCPGAWVDDMDSPAMKGGRMVARITAGAAADDRLSLVTTGFGADDITLGEGTVSYGGVPMGEVSGGDGRPLTVAFTTDAASPAAAGALLRAVRFAHPGRTPGSAVRTVA